MYIHIYTYIHTYIHIYIHTYIYVATSCSAAVSGSSLASPVSFFCFFCSGPAAALVLSLFSALPPPFASAPLERRLPQRFFSLTAPATPAVRLLVYEALSCI